MANILESILQSTKYYAPESWVPGKSEEIARLINLCARDGNEAALIITHMICDSNGFRHTVETGGADQFYTPYYGRGYIKLTWRGNYQEASRDLCEEDLIHNPDIINSSVEWCTRVSLWYWEKRVRPVLDRSVDKSFHFVAKTFNPEAERDSDYGSERYEVYCQAARMLGVKSLMSYH
ncbi:uncharacterized protein LOC129729145 [Wyeomyia smithii]|uniref:uncharacterized protein LOC129729145 n=1 Tax=Wyeomyia smithii TaxID=174621 RepID=UPI002467E596|nr:uncharacterized protein LOC129729145 [Wyeomyia smithii]